MPESIDNTVSEDIPSDDKPLYIGKKKLLICHIMNNENQEIDTVKSRVYNQEFTWKKRIWVIDNKGIWTDKKGIGHAFFDIKYTDGQMRLYQLEAKKSFIDQCVSCGKKIGIDSQNARDMVKRKTIGAIWGVDSSHILLLMILGIAVMIALGIIMYMYGENQKLVAQIAKQSASLILGVHNS